MRKILKNVFFMTLVISLFMTNIVNAAEPTVTLDPASPTPKSTVTFTAEIDDEGVISVWLWTQECDARIGICYPDTIQNISMTEQTDGSYKVTAGLKRLDVTYLQYTLNVETSDGWKTYLELTKVNLSLDQNGDGSANGADKTPGFELILVIASIVVALFIYTRKRK